MFKTSCLFEANYNATEDILVNQGGSSSGKTYSILQVLFTKALQDYSVITVVGESIPNLKAGALRDALDIYNSSEILKSFVIDYNKSDRIFTFLNGSVMEFKSYEDSQGAKSGKRDYLFINEAQGISYDIFNVIVKNITNSPHLVNFFILLFLSSLPRFSTLSAIVLKKISIKTKRPW